MGRTVLVIYVGLGMAAPYVGFGLVACLERIGVVESGPAGSQRLVRRFAGGQYCRYSGHSLSLRFQQKIPLCFQGVVLSG